MGGFGRRHTLQTCLSLLARRPTLPAPGARAAAASTCAPTQGLTSAAAAAGGLAPPGTQQEQADRLPAMLVPRAVALQGGAPPQPAPKRRKLDAPALSAPARPASAREVARREWGPPQFASVLPALYTRHGSTAAEAAAIASGEPLPAPPKKGQAPRPNHFLALQVSHAPGVVSAIQRVQASVAKHSPHLKKACVDAVSSHLTLGVMALNSEEELEAAQQAMLALGPELQRQGLAAPLELSLAGLSSFNDQVLYLDVEEGEGLQQLLAVAAAVRAHFDAAGLLQDGNRAFVPHVTVAKMSKMPRGGGGGGGWRDGKRGKGGARGRGKEKGRRHGGRDRDWRGAYEALMVADEEEAGMELAGTLDNTAEVEEAAVVVGSSVCGASAGVEAAAEAGAVAAVEGGEREEDCEEEDMGPAKVADEELEAGDVEGVAAAPAGRHDRRGKHSRRSADGGEGERQRRPHIPPESYSAHSNISCGGVRVAEVQLCRMLGRQPGQYYPVVTCVALEGAAEAAAEAGSGDAA